MSKFKFRTCLNELSRGRIISFVLLALFVFTGGASGTFSAHASGTPHTGVSFQQHFVNVALLNRAYYLAAQETRSEQEAYIAEWIGHLNSSSFKNCIEPPKPSLFEKFLGRQKDQEFYCKKAHTELETAHQEFVHYLKSRPEPETSLESALPSAMAHYTDSIQEMSSTLLSPSGSPRVQGLYERDEAILLRREKNLLASEIEVRLTFLGAKDLAEFTLDVQKQVAEICKTHSDLAKKMSCQQTKFPSLWRKELAARWDAAISEIRHELRLATDRAKNILQELGTIRPWVCDHYSDTLQLGVALHLRFQSTRDPDFLAEWTQILKQSGLCVTPFLE